MATSTTSKKKNKATHAARSEQTHTAKYSLARPPSDRASLFNLGLDFFEFCHHPDSCFKEEYPISKGYSPTAFFKMTEKDSEFAHWINLGIELLGLRMLKDAYKRKADRQTVFEMLPAYSQTYRDIQQEKANFVTRAIMERKQQMDDKQQLINVYLDGIKQS